ncbi:hypothetical protein FY528_17085 [Hymenobacter lutimineralis]|uniref:Lipocalin-like domain-containing protein n=1 Tax=Hymenobacter lutimineralis TaxID=2606448 RepID=A0A5D6UT97_9BACT|nr:MULTISPECIES: hypothetical protein [Hymenobacter]QIX60819.1 hypothetical protein HER32_06360 [Hymenobacter sp. BT18]TYZ06776.1 hypothetical protein FY528_17085 [Hymenobacter lutimineralis]
MRFSLLLACLSLVLMASTCTSSDPRRGNSRLLLLERTWLHAHEEDQGDLRVYRPNTYAFPPSRGRTGFAFEHNGLFTQYDIAPTDGLEGHRGQWKALTENQLSITLDDHSEPDYQLEIVTLEPDLLKVRRTQ